MNNQEIPNSFSKVIFREKDDKLAKDLFNSYKYKKAPEIKYRKWTPENAYEERFRKKRKREDNYLKKINPEDRPVFLVKKKHEYKGIEKVENLIDPKEEDYYKVTENTNIIEDIEKEINSLERFIRKHTFTHNFKKKLGHKKLDEDMGLSSFFKVEGKEFLPEGFIELDPILYKDEYAFENKLDEKLFEKQQRRLKMIRRKQYEQRNKNKIRDVTIFVMDVEKNNTLNFLKDWFEKNGRKMDADEIDYVSSCLKIEPRKLIKLQELFFIKNTIINNPVFVDKNKSRIFDKSNINIQKKKKNKKESVYYKPNSNNSTYLERYREKLNKEKSENNDENVFLENIENTNYHQDIKNSKEENGIESLNNEDKNIFEKFEENLEIPIDNVVNINYSKKFIEENNLDINQDIKEKAKKSVADSDSTSSESESDNEEENLKEKNSISVKKSEKQKSIKYSSKALSFRKIPKSLKKSQKAESIKKSKKAESIRNSKKDKSIKSIKANSFKNSMKANSFKNSMKANSFKNSIKANSFKNSIKANTFKNSIRINEQKLDIMNDSIQVTNPFKIHEENDKELEEIPEAEKTQLELAEDEIKEEYKKLGKTGKKIVDNFDVWVKPSFIKEKKEYNVDRNQKRLKKKYVNKKMKEILQEKGDKIKIFDADVDNVLNSDLNSIFGNIKSFGKKVDKRFKDCHVCDKDENQLINRLEILKDPKNFNLVKKKNLTTEINFEKKKKNITKEKIVKPKEKSKKKIKVQIDDLKRVTISGRNDFGDMIIFHKLKPLLIGDSYFFQTIDDIKLEEDRRVFLNTFNCQGQIITSKKLLKKKVCQFYENEVINTTPFFKGDSAKMILVKNEKGEIIQREKIRSSLSLININQKSRNLLKTNNFKKNLIEESEGIKSFILNPVKYKNKIYQQVLQEIEIHNEIELILLTKKSNNEIISTQNIDNKFKDENYYSLINEINIKDKRVLRLETRNNKGKILNSLDLENKEFLRKKLSKFSDESDVLYLNSFMIGERTIKQKIDLYKEGAYLTTYDDLENILEDKEIEDPKNKNTSYYCKLKKSNDLNEIITKNNENKIISRFIIPENYIKNQNRVEFDNIKKEKNYQGTNRSVKLEKKGEEKNFKSILLTPRLTGTDYILQRVNEVEENGKKKAYLITSNSRGEIINKKKLKSKNLDKNYFNFVKEKGVDKNGCIKLGLSCLNDKEDLINEEDIFIDVINNFDEDFLISEVIVELVDNDENKKIYLMKKTKNGLIIKKLKSDSEFDLKKNNDKKNNYFEDMFDKFFGTIADRQIEDEEHQWNYKKKKDDVLRFKDLIYPLPEGVTSDMNIIIIDEPQKKISSYRSPNLDKLTQTIQKRVFSKEDLHDNKPKKRFRNIIKKLQNDKKKEKDKSELSNNNTNNNKNEEIDDDENFEKTERNLEDKQNGIKEIIEKEENKLNESFSKKKMEEEILDEDGNVLPNIMKEEKQEKYTIIVKEEKDLKERIQLIIGNLQNKNQKDFVKRLEDEHITNVDKLLNDFYDFCLLLRNKELYKTQILLGNLFYTYLEKRKIIQSKISKSK